MNELCGDKRVSLVETDRYQSATTNLIKTLRCDTLYSAAARCHQERQSLDRFLFLRHCKDGCNYLALFEREEVHDGFALSRAAAFWQVVHLELVDLTAIGEKEEVGVRRGREELSNEILFFCVEIDDTHTAALLPSILPGISPFDVAALCQHEYRILVGDEIFRRENCRATLNDLGAPVVAKLFHDIFGLFFDETHQLFVTFQKRGQLFDERLYFFEFVFYFLALQAGKFLEAHVEYCLRLDLRKLKLAHQARSRIVHVFRLLNKGDDFIDMIQRSLEAEQNMLALLGPRQVEFRATSNDHLAVRDEILEQRFERKSLRYAIDKRHDVVMKGFFELCVLV